MSKAADKAYEKVRASILSGDYAPGSHLKEEQIADEAGVSRTPVREALQRLASEQLVQFITNRGAYVTNWSVTDVAEVYELRSLLEGHAAFRAATRISQKQIDALVGYACEIESLSLTRSAANHVRMLELNQSFHTTILEASASERLRTLLSWLVEMPMLLKTYEKFDDEEVARSNHHHRELIHAFKAGDANWARNVMETHLRSAFSTYAKSVDEAEEVEQTPQLRAAT